MYSERKKTEFQKEYCTWIWNQPDQEIDNKMKCGRMEKREEWRKLLRMARNCHILHMPME
jgi:hypothetical protein